MSALSELVISSILSFEISSELPSTLLVVVDEEPLSLTFANEIFLAEDFPLTGQLPHLQRLPVFETILNKPPKPDVEASRET